MPLHIHVVSFGKHQKPKKTRWWRLNKNTFTIKADTLLPLAPELSKTSTGLDTPIVFFYENNVTTVSCVASLQIALLNWIRKKQKAQTKKEEEDTAKKSVQQEEGAQEESQYQLYVYIRSNSGRVRSVYLAQKLCTFLQQLGHSADVHHLELSRKGLNK